MTVHPRAIAPAVKTAGLTISTALGALDVSVQTRVAGLEDDWSRLQEATQPTPAQALSWAKGWLRMVLAPSGGRAAIIVARDAFGQVQFIWPFERVQRHGVGILQWLGQAHANYNMGLYAAGVAKLLTAADMRALLRAVARLVPDASVMALHHQPVEWSGAQNPFADLGNQPSPSSGHALKLKSDFEELFRERFSKRSRKTLRRKRSKLEEAGNVSDGWATSADARIALLEVFFRQKAEQFAETGINDPFADTATQAFLTEMARLPDGDPARIEIGSLSVGGEVLAVGGGGRLGDSFYLQFCSISIGEHSRQSPGALLMAGQIEACCQTGVSHFDLGVGEGRHKSDWSDQEMVLFDTYAALRASGRVPAAVMAMAARAKRAIKTNDRLFSALKTARQRLRGRQGAGLDDGAGDIDV